MSADFLSPAIEQFLDDCGDSAVTTIEKAGRLLGLGRSAAYRAADAGDLPTIRINRRRVVPVAPLLALVGCVAPNSAQVPAGSPGESDAARPQEESDALRGEIVAFPDGQRRSADG